MFNNFPHHFYFPTLFNPSIKLFSPCLPFVQCDRLNTNPSWANALDLAGSFNAARTVEEAFVTYCTVDIIITSVNALRYHRSKRIKIDAIGGK